MKLCVNCNHVKPDTDFYPDHRENYRHQCKSCLREQGRDYHYRNAARTPEQVETPDIKTCSGCQDDLPITDFYRDAGEGRRPPLPLQGLHQASSQVRSMIQ